MKSILLVFALIGLAVGWGMYGQKQIRTGLYDCEARVETLCFSWKKNDLGRLQDKVNDSVNRSLN